MSAYLSDSSDEENHTSSDHTSTSKALLDFSDINSSLRQFANDASIAKALNANESSSDTSGILDHMETLNKELADAEAIAIKQYQSSRPEIDSLSNSLQACDNSLALLQEMLLGFQADLGGISEEIKTIQDESLGMGVRLKNRKEVEGGIRGFVEKIIIPPSLFRTICEHPNPHLLSVDFLEAVEEVERKYLGVCKIEPEMEGLQKGVVVGETLAGREVKTHLRKVS